ncbi:MAG: hypothetical protein ACI8XM_000936 [Haloarculaceae archaeon]|jgi:hypothetical protein
MTVKQITVNGKSLSGFERYDGTDRRAMARRLLAYDDAVDIVEEGAGYYLSVWLCGVRELKWRPPESLDIVSVSTFCGPNSCTPSVAIGLDRVDGEEDE